MSRFLPKEWTFRPRRKLGQFYVNIPGEGSTAVEANPDQPNCLDEALRAAKQAFMSVYARIDPPDAASPDSVAPAPVEPLDVGGAIKG